MAAEEGGGEREAIPKPSTPSLFPLFPLSSNPPNPNPTASSISSSGAVQWLSNPSFTFDVSAIPASGGAGAALPPELAISSSDDEAPSAAAEARAKSYDLVPSPSSPSPSSEEEERSSRRRERRRKKKRKRERGKEGVGEGASRKSGVRAWAGSERKPSKDYYFDACGDRDNLAFGCIYRMDIARYKLHSLMELSGLNFQVRYRWRSSASHMDVDADQDGLDHKLRSGGRYYSAKYATVEKNKGFKHVKIIEKKMPSMVPEDYIPLGSNLSSENGGDMSIPKGELEASWDDELIRKTRDFNKKSRDFPHDENVWLAFAEFQDKIASTQPQKAARLQTIEKKISILEKAVELNPDSEELMLCLLRSYHDRDTGGNILGKWEKILMQHLDSCRLWKEYLLFCQSEFSRFKVSEIRKSYSHAIQALSSSCDKLCRQDCQIADVHSSNSSLVQLELGLVDIFVSLCRFEWQTGYRELTTGLFQAQIEYSLLCPTLLLTPYSKKRLFEHFWNSGGARIGEEGAAGWSKWLAKDEENRKNVIMPESSQEAEVGGWSGWFDPLSMKSEMNEELDNLIGPTLADGNEEEHPDTEDAPLQEDVESLLKKLGIDIDAESNSEVKDVNTWKKWSLEELSRDNEQWMPVYESSESAHPDNPAQDGDEQLSRVILFDDVSDYLFSLSSEEARLSLLCQFVDFYGGKISQWTSTNKSSWLDRILSLETVPDDILKDLRGVWELVNKIQASSDHLSLESLMGSKSDSSTSTAMMKFLRNAILLSLDVFPRNDILEEALLVTEEILSAKRNLSSSSANASRALAKNLLKKDRQDLLLCGIYARREASHGNIDLGRKILDMALLSVDGVAQDLQENVPLLYLWYAEMELETSTSSCNIAESSLQRAVYILSCLGSKLKYTPFKNPISGPQVLRARQGFREQIKSLRYLWARGSITKGSVALVCSASLFETLTSGWSAGLEVIEETFSATLSGRRSSSLELETLWIYYVGLLQKHSKQLKFSKVRGSITEGLQIYPNNSKTYAAMLGLSCRYMVSNKVRLLLDKCIERNPSVIAWLFALSFEWDKPGSSSRIHGLFERALANNKLQKSVLLWRCYLAYEADIVRNPSAARRVFFRAIHACPWSKRLWLDGFQKLSSILTLKELSDLQEVMRDKELNIRTDIYEILLQDETEA
ncbi:protein NRDE2 homolog isoform X1 [Ananas comosus]|uniref:Protein NRDE2 homolog isoform X1 n=1 Tax=Ananas comosus TaxID=4615 RepID=A0A6P5F2D6_ANACO|nr:protein NRDE2 homolog isoform X1 [Ananas comosus]